MVVIPTDDLLVPPAWQYELAGLMPEVRVVEVVDARHEVVWTHPDRILDELSSFLT
jgi:pimeloyl-ACP methyl ester carboxylesterase